MTRGQKNAITLLLITFGVGFTLGTILTAILCARTEPETVWMPQAYYTIIRENEVEAEAVKEEEAAEPELKEVSLGEFKLTAYCTCSKCCGKWADGATATGTRATPGRTIAVDPDVIPLGSKVYINGFEYTAEDTGSAIKGHRIDILFPTHQEALNFGVQYAEVAIITE